MAADHSDRLLEVLLGGMNVRDKDVRLIRLYAASSRIESEWDALFETVDVNCEPYVFNYMLTRLALRFGWDGFPPSTVAVLMGLRKKFIATNMRLLADALQFVRMLNAHDIPVLVVRGGAMRLGLLPDIHQRMSDVDIVVERSRFEECRALAFDAGYQTPGYVPHSICLEKDGRPCIDMHHCLFKQNVYHDEPTQTVVARATEVTKQGATFLVPSPEDMFLHVMVNAMDNYLTTEENKGPISWLADCVDLSRRYDISYADVVARARELGVYAQFQMALVLMRYFLPDLFGELYACVEVSVSKRLCDRMERGMGRFGNYERNADARSTAGHLLYACTYVYAEHLYLYHLDDPMAVVLKDLPGSMRTRLKTIYGTESLTELPKLVREREKVWDERRRED